MLTDNPNKSLSEVENLEPIVSLLALSESDSMISTKLAGNQPVFPFIDPLYQPLSSWSVINNTSSSLKKNDGSSLDLKGLTALAFDFILMTLRMTEVLIKRFNSNN
jgi:hypothetical protein